MPLVLSTATSPGASSWVDVSTIIGGLTDTTTLGASNPLTLAAGANSWPRDLFSGEVATTITVPSTGSWLVELSVGISVAGVVAGTVNQQSTFISLVADGVLVGDVQSGQSTAAVSSPYYLRQVLSLTSGQLLGAMFGFGGNQAGGTMTADVTRVLSMMQVA